MKYTSNPTISDLVDSFLIEAPDAHDEQHAIKRAQQFKQDIKASTQLIVKEKLLSVYAIVVLALFVLTNIGISWLVWAAYTHDLEMFSKSGYERLITPSVIMTLITGISVQVASAFIIITKYIVGAK